MLIAVLIALPIAATSAAEPWSTELQYRGRITTAAVTPDGYQLIANGVTRLLPRQQAVSSTASPLFDALFTLAQQELEQARVSQIADAAFDQGAALPCECLETGEKWKYVWTRDLAYATDLALFRFDPQRARNGLEFKLSGVRATTETAAIPSSYVVQDTGSGGSWPVSTDRIVWFLGARHLLVDPAFSQKVYKALKDTLAQDRRHVFDRQRGLYRGETSFLDWREQSYPGWTARNVNFIAESFALSTNVLFYQALQLAAQMAQARGDADSAVYRLQAELLGTTIEHNFWREDRGLYMSYSGGMNAPRRLEAYDLLGTALVILSGIAPPAHARRALANYPTWDVGSAVIWPEHDGVPIYHNRAIWPFVSAYALRAARTLDEPARIAHELRSIMRGAALAGSNMENYEFTTQATTFADGANSGPVVNSKRQLWSVAAYLDMVVEGVFGLTERDTIEPKIPRELVPMLFGDRNEIRLDLPERHITLIKPAQMADDANLLVADSSKGDRRDIRVQLHAQHVASALLPLQRSAYAPSTPALPVVIRDGAHWQIRSTTPGPLHLYINDRALRNFNGETTLAYRREQQCISLSRSDDNGIESLPSDSVCIGATASVTGAWPRRWATPRSGHYVVRLDYRNNHGPINTGITAAEKILRVQCGRADTQSAPLLLPHSMGWQASSAMTFNARAGERCEFTLDNGFNMSMLAHYVRYTGGEGGASGAINDADTGDLQITPLD